MVLRTKRCFTALPEAHKLKPAHAKGFMTGCLKMLSNKNGV